ncbi:CMRF35-like molecule 9 isoform X2 [Oncorhynchus kisutch]|uniref:CMRF35-like molecule 9 isoform X1 n=1 Tax=Oncorhynchus kisutch TaxID=8019 RepID=UPI0012DFCB08|nr:CMRF35-like molecule 9 isoform X1 [Oncorhynchus kisutch]XP_031663094.1 CMRF35-like molecule 9 isoform X1 [Oncorhynchus kisutch]XP_031663095.1 CMRF35-like molecule 9 isoform X2 [Oncorhynchus kisutch]
MVNLLVLTLKVVLLLAAVWSVCSAELITVEGYEGGKAEIRCPYREQLRSHQKYLCKGDCPVFNKNEVIKTEAGENSASNGRYSLKDIRDESVFIVTITKLMINDAGKYWCGVTNLLADDYTEVNLTVSRATPTITTTTTRKPATKTTASIPSSPTLSSLATSISSSSSISQLSSISTPSSISSSTQNGFDTSVVIIVSVTLVMLLLVLVVSLFIVYRWKFNKETAVSSAPRVNTDTRINIEGGHGDGDYEEIKDRPQQSNSGSETPTIYATANLPTSPSDSLNYASVNFHKNPSCPNEATVAIAKKGTFSGDYATVNISQNPAYSTVNHPHSSSEAPPIYSTVSKSRDT